MVMSSIRMTPSRNKKRERDGIKIWREMKKGTGIQRNYTGIDPTFPEDRSSRIEREPPTCACRELNCREKSVERQTESSRRQKIPAKTK